MDIYKERSDPHECVVTLKTESGSDNESWGTVPGIILRHFSSYRIKCYKDQLVIVKAKDIIPHLWCLKHYLGGPGLLRTAHLALVVPFPPTWGHCRKLSIASPVLPPHQGAADTHFLCETPAGFERLPLSLCMAVTARSSGA